MTQLAGDKVATRDYYDGTAEVECDCGWSGEVGTYEEYSHGWVSWYAEWKCPSCEESHTSDGEYNPREDEEWD